MIQFPETARVEWETVANAANAAVELRKKIKRGTEVEKKAEDLRIRHEAELLHQRELDADSTPALEMMTLDNYTSASAPKDLIEGVMKENGLTIVIGPSGSGKSTVALTMVQSLMSGDDWLAQDVAQIDGAVGIVSYDMDARMMMDWMNNFPRVDKSKVHIVNAYKRGNPIAAPDTRAQIVSAWKKAKVEVMVIDSFSASFFGHDQNDAAATMAHYRALMAFSLECGATSLIIIAHSTDNNSQKARGSSVHHDVADTIVSVEGTGTDPRHVRLVKYRAGLGQAQMNEAIITAPDSVTHLVELDTGQMSLKGLPLPAKMAGLAFPVLPDTFDAPDISTGSSDSDSEEDDL